MIYFTAALKTPSIPTLEETQAIVQEVHEDLQQLKPNAILETIRSWLRDFYHSAIAFSSLPLLLSLATELHFISAGF